MTGPALVRRPPPDPSPSRSNPFAKARPAATSSNSFTRQTLLPTLPSPIKPFPITAGPGYTSPMTSTKTSLLANAQRTPADKVVNPGSVSNGVQQQPNSASSTVVGSGAPGKQRQSWRLLWRGGLEIGHDGWRLDGVTFFALLSFPGTPSASTQNVPNPFENPPIQSTSNANNLLGSPFPLPSADTDLCLSLESMRGRKYLRVRGIVELKDDEVLEANEDGGVQTSIAGTSPLLAAYFTSMLCRNEKLSSQGRTLSAISIGLGDDDSANSTILIYGQLQPLETPVSIGEDQTPNQGVLRLCVGRKKPPVPPPSAKKVRPGEPLPRLPLFFPTKQPKTRPPPIPSRQALSKSRSLSRAPSVASIYAPPPPQISHASSSSSSIHPPVGLGHRRSGSNVSRHSIDQERRSSMSISREHSVKLEYMDRERERERSRERERDRDKRVSLAPAAPISGRTPGRRGEKRPRSDTTSDNDRRRKNGKIVFPDSVSTVKDNVNHLSKLEEDQSASNAGADNDDEEDIFGKRPASIPRASYDATKGGTTDPAIASVDVVGEPPSTIKSKRTRPPQQVLDNKAAIRKQCMLLLESRGVSRDHSLFKEVFGMTTKGTAFAFRDVLVESGIEKSQIQDVVNRHLDMYLPDLSSSGLQTTLLPKGMGKESNAPEDPMQAISDHRMDSEENDTKMEDIREVKPEILHSVGCGGLSDSLEPKEEVLRSIKEEDLDYVEERLQEERQLHLPLVTESGEISIKDQFSS